MKNESSPRDNLGVSLVKFTIPDYGPTDAIGIAGDEVLNNSGSVEEAIRDAHDVANTFNDQKESVGSGKASESGLGWH